MIEVKYYGLLMNSVVVISKFYVCMRARRKSCRDWEGKYYKELFETVGWDQNLDCAIKSQWCETIMMVK